MFRTSLITPILPTFVHARARVRRLVGVLIALGVVSGVSGNSEANTKYWRAAVPAIWNNATNWSATPLGATGAGVPTSTDAVVLNGNGVGNCIVGVAVTVTSITINTGYTGTLSVVSTATLTTNYDFTQNAGTFDATSSTVTVRGNLNITGGTFTNTASSVSIRGNWTMAGGATYTSGTGLVIFTTNTINHTITTAGDPFPNLMFVSTGSWILQDAMTVTSTITLNSGTVDTKSGVNNSITLGGDWVNITGTFTANLGSVTFNGSSPSLRIIGGSGLGNFYNMRFNGSGSWRTFTTAITASSNVVVDQGTLGISGSSATVQGSITVNSGATLDIGNVLAVNGGGLNGVGTVTSASTAALNMSGNGTLGGGSMTLPSLTLSGNGQTTTLAGGITVQGNLRNVGTHIFDTNVISSYPVTVGRGWSNAGTFTANGSSVTFYSAASSTSTIDNGSSPFFVMRINGTSASMWTTTLNAVTVSSNLIVDAGTMTVANVSMTVGGDVTVNAAGILTIAGDMTLNNGDLLNSGTLNALSTPTVTINGAGILGGTGTTRLPRLTLSGGSQTTTLGGAVVIKGSMTISSGHTLDVSGSNYQITTSSDWVNNGTFTPQSGTVVFVSSAIILGQSTFNNFTANARGALLTFLAGSTQTVNGLFVSSGTAGSLLKLRSTVPGSTYGLDVNGPNSVGFVSAQDADSRLGGVIIATNTCTDAGNNRNWYFTAGLTHTWWGNVGTSWLDPMNWDNGVPTLVKDSVVIVSTATNWPVLTSSITISTLTVNAGAQIDFNTWNIGLSSFTNGGNVLLEGLEVISTAPANLVGSTVTYNIPTGASFVSSTWTYRNLVINGGGTSALYSARGGIVANENFWVLGGTFTTTGSNFALAVGSDVVVNGGIFSLNGSTMNFAGDWLDTAGTFNAGTSTVSVLGVVASNSSFYGSPTFSSLRVGTRNKILTFEAGSTTTINSTLISSGTAGNLVSLYSLSPGNSWYLDNNGTNTVTYVQAQDSDARSGVTIACTTNCTNLGNNFNWQFGPPGVPSVLQTYLSSMTVTYAAATNSGGYVVEASTWSTFAGVIYSTVTPDNTDTTITVSSAANLSPNTTYYIRVGALYGATTTYNSTNPSTSTLASAILNPAVYSVFTTSVTANWTAFSVGSGPLTSEGYRLEISTASDFTGTVFFSSNTTPATSTLTVTGLTAYTTYYLRAGALNYNRIANFVTFGSTITTLGCGTITSAAGSGLWSQASSWSPPFVPGTCNPVVIAAGTTMTVDTANAVGSTATINGTLSFSRSVSSTFTVVGGSISVNAGGLLDMGSSASPIPSSIEANLVLAFGTQGKYPFAINNGGALVTYGAEKTPMIRSTTDITAGGGSPFTAETSPSGWQVGDSIAVSPTDPYNFTDQTDVVTVSNVVGNQVSYTGAVTYTHHASSGLYIANLSRNVVIRSSGTNTATNTSYLRSFVQNATSFALVNTELAYLGDSTNATGVEIVSVSGQNPVAGSISSSTIHHGYYGLSLNGTGTGSGLIIQNNNIAKMTFHSLFANGGTISNGLIINNTILASVGQGIYFDGSGIAGSNVTISSNIVAGVEGNGVRLFTLSSCTIMGNRVFSNHGDGVNISGNAPANYVIANVSYGNASSGLNIGDSSPNTTLAGNQVYSNYSSGSGNGYSLYCSNSLNLVSAGEYLGYDSAGNVGRSVESATVFIDNTAGKHCTMTFRGDTVYSFTSGNVLNGIDRTGFTANRSLISYNQSNDPVGTARVLGDFSVSGQTLALDYTLNTVASGNTTPRLMDGTGHSISGITTSNTLTRNELITVLAIDSSHWSVSGSSSGLINASFVCTQGSSCGFTSSPVNFTLNTANPTAAGDRLDFVTFAASGDTNRQKKLLFGPAAAGFNNGRSKISVASTGGLTLAGDPAGTAPTLLTWDSLNASSTYYTFVDSGAFTVSYASVTYADELGIELYNTGSVSLASTTFDLAGKGPTSSTSAYITGLNLGQALTIYGLSFYNTQNSTGPLYNINSSGTWTQVWTMQNYGGTWAGASHELDLLNKVTWGSPQAPTNVVFNAVNRSTMTIGWTAVSGSQGYDVNASTASDFSGTLFSTSTTNGSTTSLVISSAVNLSPNTTYFLRVGNIVAGATTYANTTPISTSTLANLIVPVIYQSSISSITVNWSPFTVGSGTNTSEGYELDASTASDFSGTLFMSSNTTPATSTLTITGLAVGTTYYLRAGAYNYNRVANFVTIGSTMTSSSFNRYWISPGASNWNNTSNWSYSPGGSGGAVVPASTDNVFFNASGVGNCTIDVAVNVSSLTISTTAGTGYTGQIDTGGNIITIGGSLTQRNGTFVAGASTITIAGDLSLSSGTFNANSSSITVSGSVFESSDNFNAGSMTLSVGASWYVLRANSNFSWGTSTITFLGNGVFDNTSTAQLTLQNVIVKGQSTFSGFSKSFRGNLIIDTGAILDDTNGGLYMNDNSTVTINGTLTGTGYITLSNDARMGTGGTLTTDVYFQGSGTPLTMQIPARTYGANVFVQNFATTPWTAVLQGGTHVYNGLLSLIAQTGGAITLDGATNTPTVTVNGAASTTENSTGTITWNLGGNWNFGTALTLSSGTLNANGAAVTFSSNVVIGAQATFNGQTSSITVQGNWNRSGLFQAGTSTVTFTGVSGSTSTLLGSNTFYNFIVNSPGKRIVFTAASTATVSNLFSVNGANGNLVVFRSSATGTAWALKSTGTQVVTFVDVQDSNANSGNTIAAGITSRNISNNFNWTFSTPPSAPSITAVYMSSATLTWGTTSPSLGYVIEAATGPAFAPLVASSATTLSLTSLTFDLGSLGPNATYYLRVGNLYAGATSYNGTTPSTSTLTSLISPVLYQVFGTSITVNWPAFAAGTGTATSEGYALNASTASDFSGTVFFSSTTLPTISTLTVTGLTPFATYYLRAGAYNYNRVANFVSVGSTSTASMPPVAPTITAVALSTIAVQWTTVSPSNGYLVNASTAPDFSGTLYSTATTDGTRTSLIVSSAANLSPNTTYYIRVGNLYNGTTSYNGTTPSTSTLASLISPVIYQVFGTSITVNWPAFAAGSGSNTSEGYELNASTASNFTGTVFVSSNSVATTSTLTVTGLTPFATYYLRAGAYNYNRVANFVTAGSTATTNLPPNAPSFANVYLSTMVVQWTTVGTSSGYLVQASTAANFTGTLLSTATTDGTRSSLVISSAANLAPNTTYYVRLANLYNGTTSFNLTTPSTSTLASLVSNAIIYQVTTTSITANWSAFTAGIGANTGEGYELDLSTASDFSGTLFMSSNTTPTISTLTIGGLTSGNTYYARVGAYNYNRVANFVTLGSTRTVSGPAAITDLTATAQVNGDVTLTWSAPLDSVYNPLTVGSQYAIEWSTYNVTWSTSNVGDTQSTNTWHVYIATSGVSAGAAQSYITSGLTGNINYNFRIWTQNPGGFWSPISNSTNVVVSPVLSVTISSHSYNFGTVNIGGTTISTTAVVVTNLGNVTQTYSLAVATTGAQSVWAVGASTPTSFDTFVLLGAFHGVQPSSGTFNSADVITGVSAPATANVYSIDGSQTGVSTTPNTTRSLWFQLMMPLTVSTTNQQQMNVTVTAATP